MKKLLICDLDGTLLDSIPDITVNLNLMLKKFGFAPVTDEKTKKIIGYGAKQLVKNAIGKPIKEELLLECLDFYNRSYTDCGNLFSKVFDGIENMLYNFKSKGYSIVILSNKPQETTDKICTQFFKEFALDAVFGQTEGRKTKPDPQAVIDVLKEFDVSPENALLLGDMETDFIAATKANVKCVIAGWGYGNREYLRNLGAEFFASTANDVFGFIN